MRASLLVAMVLGASCGSELSPVESVGVARQGLESFSGFGNPGNLEMYRERPAGLQARRPLVVALHGCGDTAENFVSATGLRAQSQLKGFALLVPQQKAINNAYGCFNWFDSQSQRAGAEMESIRQAIDKTVADYQLDSAQVFVVGFSAGAAHAINLAGVYPGRLAAVVSVAGIPFKCAEDLFASSSCLAGSTNKTPEQWADKVRGANSGFTGPWPRISIWQGQTDGTVNPANATELLEQWTQVHGIDRVEEDTLSIPGGGTRARYGAALGARSLVEVNLIPGVGHAWRTSWAAEIVGFFEIQDAPDGGPVPELDAGAGPAPDAGPVVIADAGIDAGHSMVDAGVDAGVDGGANVVQPAQGCAVVGAPMWLLLLALLRRRR